jgi:RNA polymerase sigma-70 factor, ECF subfamily
MVMPGEDATRFVALKALGDAELVLLARRPDGDAFRVIMQRHNQRLYRLARAVMRNDSEAEDVVQEAYVRAFTNLATFRGDSSLATWLSRIVLNEAFGRSRRRRETVDLTAIESRQQSQGQIIASPHSSPQIDPERAMAQREIQLILERAIDRLPETFRTVLVARVIEEMSVGETAILLGLRPETVKTRLHRARGLLKKALNKDADSDLIGTFPFGGERCERLTRMVLDRLSLPARRPREPFDRNCI